MIPSVISEQLVCSFVFYHAQDLRRGIRYRGELYEFVREFKVDDRLLAYRIICELANQGNEMLITVSQTHYTGWINLRSQGYQQWSETQHQGRKLIETI
ncbi:MAG: hypothetical protein SFW36_06600 [Leptolyngbyaceae cyanobacterium bins.59]|nr:hypothetical protein [Leptolyngbyaceae cyanobacterium bins.59]